MVGKFIPEDEQFWEVVPRGSYMERIGMGFEFTEGPAWHPEGHLVFSDIPSGKIYSWTGRKFRVYIDSSNQSNGLETEPGGALLVCEHQSRSVSRYTLNGSKEIMAHRYTGRRLNSPNDLCRSTLGVLYFTDPPWGLPGLNDDPAKELPFNGVFMLRNGQLTCIDSTLSWPNGIALSPDERFLYVANVEPGTDRGGAEPWETPVEEMEVFWMRYHLNTQGEVEKREVFYRAGNPTLQGGPDGMEVDRRGNLVVTGPGGILVVDPAGKWLGTIEVPEIPSNLAFSPRDRELYITARSNLYRIVFER